MEKLIGLLFLDRNLAHIEHLRTASFAQHMALGSFYDDVIELADKLAEAYQGYEGKLEGIPLLSGQVKNGIDNVLEEHMQQIEDMRYDICSLSAIQNIIDEIVGLYLSTIYKLRELS